ncbi:MAG: hypothetical protein RLZZ37_1071 [Actinomycetota bacterium]
MNSFIKYTKGNGTKNDFVIIEDLNDQLEITASQVKEICDRNSGIGADGILRVVKNGSRYFMDYRNADGSIAEMCGNGARVFGLYLKDRSLVTKENFVISTRAGDVEIHVMNPNEISVTMNGANIRNNPVEITNNSKTYKAIGVDAPNPHAVVFVEDLNEIGELKIAPISSPKDEFIEGVNVEFVKKVSDNHVQMRVFERGSGETLSCGTGACAVAAVLRKLSNNYENLFQIDVRGGTLFIKFIEDKIVMTGPAVLENTGILKESWYSIKK